MKKKLNIDELNIGIVLSGGGAKGAYEAGVFKALDELELINKIKIISGTSIGVINGLMLSMENSEVMDKSWNNLSYSRFIINEESARKRKIAELISGISTKEKGMNIIKQIQSSDIGLLSQNGVRKFIEEYIDIKAVKASNKTIYACAYNTSLGVPEYFDLKEHDEKEIIDIALASCAIPYIFKPIKIKDYKYADGGINNPLYKSRNADNVPIEPLKNHNCNFIIIVYLSHKDKIDKSLFDDKKIIEIYPSQHLENITGIGTLNLKHDTLMERLELGYRDALVILAPIIIGILYGKNIDLLLDKQNAYNEVLLSRI